jgi:hypothetical protein
MGESTPGLGHQSVVGERFATGGSPEHEAEEFTLAPAAFEAVDESSPLPYRDE